MALIDCPECGRQVSDRARSCPGCGYPVERIARPTMRILIVDDSSFARRFLGSMLDDLGAEILEAGDGREAIELLGTQTQPVSLALLDWTMPTMNGLETLQAFKNNPVSADIPVIMVTGEKDLAKIGEAMEAGACGYIIKPCEKDDLLGKIYHALEARGGN